MKKLVNTVLIKILSGSELSYKVDTFLDRFNHAFAWKAAFKFYKMLFKLFGFNLVGITRVFFEATFIFNTDHEAKTAYAFFEKEHNMCIGFWHSNSDLLYQLKKLHRSVKICYTNQFVWSTDLQ